MIFFVFFFSLLFFSRDLPNSPKNVRPWHRAPVVVSSSSSFCSCYPPRPSKARWNRHLLCSFVLSQTSRRKTVFFNHRSEIQLSIWMMRNSPRQFWIHHSPFKVVFFCDKEAKSNIVSKFSQFFSTGLCSRSVSPTLFCSPHWNTNLTLSLATAWKLHFFN